MPKISVIVPVYNVEQYLHRCIDSILAQTFADFELILVDDGSPDNCGAICDEYAVKDSRVVVIHQENGGISAARNAGIDWAFANSDSEWLNFIDSDDWVHPQYLELLYSACREYGTDIAVCQYQEVEDNSVDFSIINMRQSGCMDITAFFCAKKLELSWVSSWAKLFHKHIFRSYRYPVGTICEDLHAVPDIQFINSEIATVHVPLYFYYLSPNSIMRSHWSPKMMDEVRGYEKLLAYLKAKRNTMAYNCAMRRFLAVLTRQCHSIQELAEPGYIMYLKQLRKKMRRIIICNPLRLNLDFEKDKWIYDQAFPVLMWCYWIMKARLQRWIR